MTAYRTLQESVVDLGRRPFRRRGPRPELFWALDNVSFELARGDALGIIGRNGAGKSTLLKVLARITRPTRGVADVYGRIGSLLEVGTGFHPELSGRENIYLNGAILGMTQRDIRRRFDEIVAFAEIEQFLETPVKRYSSGMYMRLAFAVAAHLETEILIVDEVLAVGDAGFQAKCLGKMEDAAGQGRTILFVSHNMAAVRTLCRTAMLLDGGQTGGVIDVESAILRYSAQTRESSIPAPLDRGDLSISEFRVSQQGVDLVEFDAGRPIDLLIRCRLKKDLRDFRIGILVRTEQGDTISRSFLADWDRSKVDVTAGEYVLEGSIPANFLAGGKFVISPHASVFGLLDYALEEHIARSVLLTTPPTFNQAYPSETDRRITGVVVMDAGWRLARV